MRLSYSVFWLVLVVTFLGRSDAAPTSVLDTTENAKFSTKRFLGRETEPSSMKLENRQLNSMKREREIGAAQVFGTVVKAMRAKAKLTIMLGRGFSPAKTMKKLRVTTLKDKNFNSFARYYAKYFLSKYPKKAETLPKTAEEATATVKLKQWIGERVLPPGISQKLHEFGQKDIEKYTKVYMQLWDKNQAKLSALVKSKRG